MQGSRAVNGAEDVTGFHTLDTIYSAWYLAKYTAKGTVKAGKTAASGAKTAAETGAQAVDDRRE